MNVAIFGLGRFGTQLCHELIRIGTRVLAVDKAAEQVEPVVDLVTLAADGDATQLDFLRSLDLHTYDSLVVAVGSDVATSVLMTLTMKRQLGHRHVVAKARDVSHARSLELAGADVVVNPEQEAANRLAHTLGSVGVDDYMSLDQTSGIARVAAPTSAIGRGAADFEPIGSFKVYLIARIRAGHVTLNPDPEELVLAGDTWVVAGNDQQIQRLRH